MIPVIVLFIVDKLMNHQKSCFCMKNGQKPNLICKNAFYSLIINCRMFEVVSMDLIESVID